MRIWFVRAPPSYHLDNAKEGFQVPIFSPQEGFHKLSPPIICDIFLFAIFRTDKQMNVMSEFVIEDIGNCNVPRERDPKHPPRPLLEKLIDVEFDPGRLPVPFSMVEAG
jgi:hypothetical protein